MNASLDLAQQALELRRRFDDSFAVAAAETTPDYIDLLAVRVAEDAYVIALSEVTSVFVARPIVAVPAEATGLLGLIGVRGEVIPVFALASLLGYGTGVDVPRWMITCGTEYSVAIGFSDLEGYVRIPRAALSSGRATQRVSAFSTDVASTPSGVRPVLSIARLLRSLTSASNASAREDL
jgi:chemotaxis signal transduction protein